MATSDHTQAFSATPMGDHVADIAHELRTPAAIALGLADRLRKNHGLLPDARRDVDRMEANLRIIQTHVQTLLTGVRIESVREPAEALQDIAVVFRRTAQDFASVADHDGVRLRIEAPLRLDAAVAPNHLSVMLSNLLVNAIRSTPRHGLVRCVLRADEDGVTLEVTDSGVGIAADDRVRVMERFSDRPGGGAGRARENGSIHLGLGLDIVHRIARSYGGHVTIGEGPDGGAAVGVSLPGHTITRLPAVQDAPIVPAVPPDDPTADSHPLIALVTDTTDVRDRLVTTISRDHARNLLTITGADQLHPGIRPDCLVIAPGCAVRARGVIARLREDHDHEEIPVLALVPIADVRGRLDLLQFGVDDVVDPVISDDELQGRIDRHVARSRRDRKRRLDASRFRRAFHDSAIGMGVATINGQWEAVNPALCAITRLPESQLLQRGLFDFDAPDDADTALLNDLLAGRTRAFQVEKRWLIPCGTPVWVRLALSVERDAVGAASGLVVQVEECPPERHDDARPETRLGREVGTHPAR